MPNPMPNPGDAPSSCLHLVVGANAQALDDCLRHLAPDDAVVLLDCGVLHLLRSASTAYFDQAARVSYAAADLAAHGLAETARWWTTPESVTCWPAIATV